MNRALRPYEAAIERLSVRQRSRLTVQLAIRRYRRLTAAEPDEAIRRIRHQHLRQLKRLHWEAIKLERPLQRVVSASDDEHFDPPDTPLDEWLAGVEALLDSIRLES